ncbi:MAG: NAD-dependent epimerase/dehydratase family protein [Deltaproteobacteria bacterium]|nr:MAG: NAD-dependent epimerase/dehydratase family protein [Deltaproteobacteria bacterium]
MPTLFMTGATGYLGAYTATRLLAADPDIRLATLVRAKDEAQAREKLWRAMQLHMDVDAFRKALGRIDIVRGDLHAPDLGIAPKERERLVAEADSILHIAASLNRKSSKACFNTNLRGTLSVINLARAIQNDHGLRRYSHVSTVAVAGERSHEVVTEDMAIDWGRSDYDPYGRTKKFAEHMAHELLPDVQKTIFRPSIVMGDSRFCETTQFDMVRAFCVLADLPVLPFSPNGRLDIVNADWVADAISHIHLTPEPKHDTYHLSAGERSLTTSVIAHAMTASTGRAARFAPGLLKPFKAAVDLAGGSRAKNPVTLVGSLLKVFLPYITYDTVFDNRRAVAELGYGPTPFTAYCGPLYRWAKEVRYRYPYAPLPAAPAGGEEAA